jgi:hypothetical protein
MPNPLWRCLALSMLLTALVEANAQTPTNTAPRADPPALPEGRWQGELTFMSYPDVDSMGLAKAQVQVTHCAGRAQIIFPGKYESERQVNDALLVPAVRIYLLVFGGTQYPDGKGWTESQVWTLVDARPKSWTLTQSRAVLNQGSPSTEPWYTFRHLAWGNVEHDPNWCEAKPSPPR